jgi:hypothetical protein
MFENDTVRHRWWSTAAQRTGDDEEVMDNSSKEYGERCVRHVQSMQLLGALEENLVCLDDVLALPLDWSTLIHERDLFSEPMKIFPTCNELTRTIGVEATQMDKMIQRPFNRSCSPLFAASSSSIGNSPDLSPLPLHKGRDATPNTSMATTPLMSVQECADETSLRNALVLPNV